MQETQFFNQRKAAVALCIVLIIMSQQVCSGPVDQSPDSKGEKSVHTRRRIARMSPLWRILSSKPYGAYCQNNYECITGLCRAGYCSTSHRSPSEPVNY